MRARRAWFTAALAGVAALVAACADSSPRLSAQPLSSAQLLSMQHRLDDVYERITGTAAQRDAGEYLRYDDLNHGVEACMRERGYVLNWRFVGRNVGYRPHATETTRYLAEPRTRFTSERAVTRAMDDEGAGRRPAASGTRAFGKASNACHRQNPPRHGSDSGSYTGSRYLPAKTYALTHEFTAMIDGVDTRLGDGGDYEACMRSRGVDLDDDSDDRAHPGRGHLALLRHLDDVLPVNRDIKPATSTSPAGPRWQAFLDHEADVLDQDARCRIIKYQLGMALLVEPLREFLSGNRDAIDRVQSTWARILESGKRNGFDTTPYR